MWSYLFILTKESYYYALSREITEVLISKVWYMSQVSEAN